MFIKKKPRPKTIIRLIVLLTVVLMIILPPTINPFRRTDAGISRYLLSITPAETGIEDVIESIKSNKSWLIIYRDDWGYAVMTKNYKDFNSVPNSSFIGAEKAIVRADKYGVIFHTILVYQVYITYHFDEDSNLVDISVEKSWLLP